MARKRHSAATGRALDLLSGGTCYYPECKEPVVRFVEGQPVVNVEVAHIHSASPQGPRSDQTMSNEDLSSFNNLILLCQIHHRAIDSPSTQSRYPASLLRSWKSERESGLSPGMESVTESQLTDLLEKAFRDLLVNMPSLRSHDTSPAVREPVWNVPYDDNKRTFFGRYGLLKELQSHQVDRQGMNTVAVTQTLTGLGGTGKTQVAIRFAYDSRPQLDLTWWITAQAVDDLTDGSTGLLEGGLVSLGRELVRQGCLSADVSYSSAEMVTRVRTWLEQTPSRWLLVIDNAPGPEVTRGLLPQDGNGLVLITSRNQHWTDAGVVLKVDVFDIDEGAQFLQARTGRSDLDGARRLAIAVGGHALVLEQAAALLRAVPSLSCDEYLQCLRDEGLELLDGPAGVVSYDQVIARVFTHSFDRLAQRSGEAAELLSNLAVLAPTPVPIDFLRQRTRAKAARTKTRPEADAHLAMGITEANRFSLVQATDSSLTIHRLVHATLNSYLERPVIDSSLKAMASRFVERLGEADLEDGGMLAPHAAYVALSLVEAEDAQGTDLNGNRSQAVELFGKVETYLAAQGMESQTQAFYADLLEAFWAFSEPPWERLADLMRSLARYDHRRAESLLESAVEMYDRECPIDHPGAISALISLARIRRPTGVIESSVRSPDLEEASRRCSEAGDLQNGALVASLDPAVFSSRSRDTPPIHDLRNASKRLFKHGLIEEGLMLEDIARILEWRLLVRSRPFAS